MGAVGLTEPRSSTQSMEGGEGRVPGRKHSHVPPACSSVLRSVSLWDKSMASSTLELADLPLWDKVGRATSFEFQLYHFVTLGTFLYSLSLSFLIHERETKNTHLPASLQGITK